MVEVYLHYYLRYNYMFRLSNNSHLQVVHETLGNSYGLRTVWCGGWVGYEISYVSLYHCTQPILITCITVS